jgi:hypothetical protein
MNIEIKLEDVCLDLLVRKHVYTTVTIYGREYMRRSGRRCCCLYINIFTWKRFEECVREETVKGLGELLAYQVYFEKNAFLFFIITVIVRSGSIRNCEIAQSALANLENLRNCVLRTTKTKLWNCVLRTWKTYCAAHLWWSVLFLGKC